MQKKNPCLDLADALCGGFSFIKDVITSSGICRLHENLSPPDGNTEASCYVLSESQAAAPTRLHLDAYSEKINEDADVKDLHTCHINFLGSFSHLAALVSSADCVGLGFTFLFCFLSNFCSSN